MKLEHMSWTTSELKKKGLYSLNKNFGQAYLVVLVFSLIADIPSVFTIQNGLFLVHTIKNSIGLLLVVSVMSAFVIIPITVGKSRFYLELRAGKGKFPTMWVLFTEGKQKFTNIIKCMIIRYISVIVGCLAFVVPGIMQYYKTFFVHWILAESPETDIKEVLRISAIMTKGEKCNIFIMQLTFVGWFVLSFFIASRITMVIPTAFESVISVMIYALPMAYYHATVAELYVELQKKIGISIK